jgi:ATP-grasp domain
MTTRPPAIIFMGDLVVVARQPRLVTEARARGLAPLLVVTPHTDPDRLAACRTDPTHPLAGIEDVIWVPDARVETVLPAVQSWLRAYDVQAVMSCGEVFVEPVGVLGDCLGLPGAGSAASRICRNKLLQRIAAGELSPAWRVVTPEERAGFDATGFPFPVVVKPVGRFYSLGVRQVNRAEDLPGILKTYPDDETVLVESRVEGPEFSVEALVQDGRVIWSGVTGKESNEHGGTFFTEMVHTSPAELPAAECQVLVDANAEVLRRVGFRDGITHAEFRMSEGGAVLMEVAARMPGDGITFLWELATGKPLEPVMIDLALGVPASYPAPRRRATQAFLDHPFGILHDVVSAEGEVSWVERDDRWPAFVPVAEHEAAGRRAVLVGRLPGATLGEQSDSSQRSVSVVFDAPLDEPTEPLVKSFSDDVTIVVDTEVSTSNSSGVMV